ncbi:hypothetical protein H6778_03805 [Candidatus Nomurabacteria bacterium]|nr:hypothetical protein [Candidatus Nomurabacteria bacterium]
MQSVNFKGFNAGINLPPALKGENLHGLPPYARTNHYRVSDYPNAPGEWSRGDDMTATYFVGVTEGSGMWIDLTGNQHLGHHIAVIPSVQGINAITALPVESNPVLEQYRHRCPVHDARFSGNRHCLDCGFDWPGQNYLTSASGKTMWIDGFRTRGGNGQPTAETRQFIFTSDESRGVAAQKIGAARSFDVALHFFRGPQKPRPAWATRGGHGGGFDSYGSGTLESFGAKGMTRGRSLSAAPEVAAGARINQDVGLDPNPVEQYGQLAGVIRIYYVYADVLQEILGTGRANEGGLSGLKVGNPTGGMHKTY